MVVALRTWQHDKQVLSINVSICLYYEPNSQPKKDNGSSAKRQSTEISKPNIDVSPAAVRPRSTHCMDINLCHRCSYHTDRLILHTNFKVLPIAYYLCQSECKIKPPKYRRHALRRGGLQDHIAILI